MNISPVSNTSFKGIIHINNKKNDSEYKATYFMQTKAGDKNIDIYDNPVLEGKGKGKHAACYTDEFGVSIDTDFIASVCPKYIYVNSSTPNKFAAVDISDVDYNTVLNACSYASQNPEVDVFVNRKRK